MEWEQETEKDREAFSERERERHDETEAEKEAVVDGRHSSVWSQTWQLVTGDKIKRSCHF